MEEGKLDRRKRFARGPLFSQEFLDKIEKDTAEAFLKHAKEKELKENSNKGKENAR